MSATSSPNTRTAVTHAKPVRTHPTHVSATPPRRHDARAALARALEATPAPIGRPPAAFTDDPRLAELLALHHLRELPDRALARLDELLRDNPPNVLERLERAATYLRLTGDRADELVDRALLRLTASRAPASRTTASRRPPTPRSSP